MLKKGKYIKKIYKFKNAIEYEEYCRVKCVPPGQKRLPRKKTTPEDIERINQYNKEKLARRRIRAHFDVHDYFVSLTYRKEERPEDMNVAKEDFKKFIRKVRKEYKKRNQILKWIRNIEVGTRGAWHVHLIINRIPDTDVILANCWPHGGIHMTLMYEKGEFAKLAAYITKSARTDSRLKESDYSASRNLPLPEPVVKTYKTGRNWKKMQIPDGWYLDPDSLRQGINPVTGHEYRTYTLLRCRRE